MRRKFWQLVGMSYGVLALIVVQLVLAHGHHRIASFAVSLVTLACIIAIWLWARRSGLMDELRTSRSRAE